MNISAIELKKSLKNSGCPKRAATLQRYFKTAPGEYGAGDVFCGLTVPQCRAIARNFFDLPFDEFPLLMKSGIHEERLVILMILEHQFNKSKNTAHKKAIFDFYMEHLPYINNWDLIDGSAPAIVGGYLENKPRGVLLALAKDKSLWSRRVAMLATFWFIKKRDFKDALTVAALLLGDKEDLIHKAVGWMLREIGNRDLAVEEVFLQKHCHQMPRTMLRYAIEKFPEPLRQSYLKGTHKSLALKG